MAEYRNDPVQRKRAVVACAVLGAFVAATSISGPAYVTLGGFLFAAAFWFVAYRGWVVGLYIEGDRVTVKNVVSNQRCAASEVKEVRFSPGKSGLSDSGYVRIVKTDGTSFRVTALRRSPDVGAALVRQIQASLRSNEGDRSGH